MLRNEHVISPFWLLKNKIMCIYKMKSNDTKLKFNVLFEITTQRNYKKNYEKPQKKEGIQIL